MMRSFYSDLPSVSGTTQCSDAVQMTAISLLLATSGIISNQGLEVAAALGAPLLVVATFLTLWSLADYMRGVWPYMWSLQPIRHQPWHLHQRHVSFPQIQS